MSVKLKIAEDQVAAEKAHRRSGGSSGADGLEKDPVAAMEFQSNRKSGFDHYHLSKLDDTPYYIWQRRSFDGAHRPFGRYMVEDP